MIKRIIIKDKPGFDKLSMQYYFKRTKNGKELNSLIFAKQDKLITLNFETEVVTDLYIYEAELQRQPSFFKMNTDQTVFITASQEDGIYYSFRSRKFIDIDAVYNISAIKEIMYDPEEKFFYLLANKYDEKLGLFILRFNEKNPNISHFFFKWKNKLDIADANITVVHNEVFPRLEAVSLVEQKSVLKG